MSAPFQNKPNAGWYRFRIGGFECTVLWDGYIHHAYDGLYPNGTPEEMQRLKALHALPQDHIPMDLNPAVVNTVDKLLVIDAGMGRASKMFGDTMGRMLENLESAGIDPDDVDIVLMTHLHPDHSFGLVHEDGRPVFRNAEVVVTRQEWDEWTDEANLQRNDHRGPWTEGTRAALAPYDGRIRYVADGDEIVPGVSVIDVAGHSSGMCAFVVESEGERVVFTGDVAHHQVFDLLHPEWFFHMDYDSDPQQGATAKERLFARVADGKIRFHGYHFPFPGLGDVVRAEDGTYRFHAQPSSPRL